MQVGSSRAKSNFSTLLKRAERGEEIVITRRGKPVAKLVPLHEALPDAVDQKQAREAVKRLRERAKAMNLGPFDWEEWKKYRDEGRR